MPEFYYKHDVGWIKQCSNCEINYFAYVKSWNDAYKEFRKNFSPRKTTRDELESSCYRCRAIAEMRIRYGVDVEEMIKSQNYGCAICGDEVKFNTGANSASACIDHDHNAGQTRGVLCRSCNLGLGHFKDDIIRLEVAVNYLKYWKSERHGTDTIKRDA